MEVVIEEGEVGEQIRADAEILLPYVFYSPPRHKVNVVFALWCGAEEISLDDQPFPVQKELLQGQRSCVRGICLSLQDVLSACLFAS